MSQLNYPKLERQEYLEDLNSTKAKTVFRFCTKMENFEGNYKGKILRGNNNAQYVRPIVIYKIYALGALL